MKMKTLAIALGTAATALATVASAQVYYNPYPRVEYTAGTECWNPRAQTFEQVRPGEYQSDLDMRNCRAIPGLENRYYEPRVYRDAREECWNRHARTFEAVRPGERQDDLDFSRCRLVSSERYYRYR
jgi:hypothetical protein